MSETVDKILELIDGALADEGQHSPESGMYSDVAPEMPEPGTCWRCTTNPTETGSTLCGGCRSFLLEDSDDDPTVAETRQLEGLARRLVERYLALFDENGNRLGAGIPLLEVAHSFSGPPPEGWGSTDTTQAIDGTPLPWPPPPGWDTAAQCPCRYCQRQTPVIVPRQRSRPSQRM